MKAREDRNYLYVVLFGIFAVAGAVLLASTFFPLEGCVGVVEIKGPIVSDDVEPTMFSEGVHGSETIAARIEEAGSRSDVKSVLVYIDSPGGSVVASSEIYHALAALEKPKVAYIHEVGASGGYYAALPADHIVANPDALTGSIGARATFADLSGLFGKLGINETSVKSGAMKDMGSMARPLTEEELAVAQSVVDDAFSGLKEAVIVRRGGKIAGHESEIFDARIMTGRQALFVGLVDSVGGKKDALAKAGQLGGMGDRPNVCKITSTQGSRGLFGSLSSEDIAAALRAWLSAPRLSY